MLVDANILLYAVDERARAHDPARRWLQEALTGDRRVGLPWPSLLAFVRIVTHPRALPAPLTAAEAWQFVTEWLEAPAAWVPVPGPGHAEILGRFITELDLRGNVVSDAALAALAYEHGVAVVSADVDFARFPEVTWINPVVR
jgi:toxin-antitoxin system PIN domain toxin